MIQKVQPKSPDPHIRKDEDNLPAKLGHVNYVIDQINNTTPKEFKAIVTQSSTNAPTITSILINTYNDDITFSYSSTGVYTLTSAGSEFTSDKTEVMPTNIDVENGKIVSMVYVDSTTISLLTSTWNISVGGAPVLANGLLQGDYSSVIWFKTY